MVKFDEKLKFLGATEGRGCWLGVARSPLAEGLRWAGLARGRY
jgi:hypothetical protein